MAYRSKKKWTDFSLGVQDLRWTLLIWLEGLLSKEVTRYEGSDSVIYEPEKWSKYKLVPFDVSSMPPLSGLDEGVLVCLDAGICESSRLSRNRVEDAFPNVRLHSEHLVYKTGRERSYRVTAFPISEKPEARREQLFALAELIRAMERSSV
jgi:hypothetical protein